MFEMLHALVSNENNKTNKVEGYALLNHLTELAIICDVKNAYELVEIYGSPNVIANRYSGYLLLIDIDDNISNYAITMSKLLGMYPHLFYNMDGVN